MTSIRICVQHSKVKNREKHDFWLFFGTILLIYTFQQIWHAVLNMCRISIPAIWDVIWGQTNLFLLLDRPFNHLSRKKSKFKKLDFQLIEAFTETLI